MRKSCPFHHLYTISSKRESETDLIGYVLFILIFPVMFLDLVRYKISGIWPEQNLFADSAVINF